MKENQTPFISSRFIGFDYPTLEGGELRLMIAPKSSDKETVSIVMAHLLPDGTNTQTLCHITQKTAADLFYQMNMFLNICDNLKMDKELLSDAQTEAFKKFNTLDKVDMRCDCGGELEVL